MAGSVKDILESHAVCLANDVPLYCSFQRWACVEILPDLSIDSSTRRGGRRTFRTRGGGIVTPPVAGVFLQIDQLWSLKTERCPGHRFLPLVL